MNFTAIDFETANEQYDSVCSVGIVVVKNGNITQKKEYFIKPKEIRFNEVNINIHGITERKIKHCPEFNEVWHEIKPYIENQTILAHNANFDVTVLEKVLQTYKIEIPYFKHICTLELSRKFFPNLKRYRLSDVAEFLGLKLDHHNSLSDALACAEIGIATWKIENNIVENFEEPSSKNLQVSKTATYIEFSDKKIDSSLLKPNLQNVCETSFFYNKKVVLTGDLVSMKRKEVTETIFKMGADINTSISKKTNIVIIGEKPGPSKLKQINTLLESGVQIEIIYEEKFLEIINTTS